MLSALGMLLAIGLNGSLWIGLWLIVRIFPLRWDLFDRFLAVAVGHFVTVLLLLESLSAVGRMAIVPAACGSGAVLFVGLGLWYGARGDRRASGSPGASASIEGDAADFGSPKASDCRSGRAGWIELLTNRFCPWALLTLAGWLATDRLARSYVFPVETISDAPIYHLPFAVRWWKARAIELVPTPFGDLAATYFPANGDLWFSWLVLGTGDEQLAKVGQWPFLLLSGVALFGIARQLGVRPPAAIVPAVLWSSTLLSLGFCGVANVDLIFAAWYLVAVFFLLRYRATREPGGTRIVLLGLVGLAAGAALGTKTVGVAFVPLVVLPALVLTLAGPRRVLESTLLLAGVLTAGGYWYIRNALLTGNPLYPLHLELCGWTLLSGWFDRSAMRASSYHIPTDAWTLAADRLSFMLDLRLAWLWLVALICALAVCLSPRAAARARWLPLSLILLGALQLVLYWWVIPYNTQERFLLAAFGLLLVPLALAVDRFPLLQILLAGLLAVHLLTPQVQTHFASPEGPGAVPLPLGTGSGTIEEVVARLALPVGIGLTLVLLFRRTPLRIACAAVALGLSFFLAGYSRARQLVQYPPLFQFYPATDFGRQVFPAWEALEQTSPAQGTRIAYAGTNLPYYLFGRQLRNQVRYVNVNAPLDWLPHDYHFARLRRGETERASDPYPQWYRANPDYGVWLANLRVARIRFLFIARENLHGRSDAPPGPAPFPIEQQWAEEHPDIFEIVGPVGMPDGYIPWARVYRLKPQEDGASRNFNNRSR